MVATIQSYIIDHWENFDFRSHGLPAEGSRDDGRERLPRLVALRLHVDAAVVDHGRRV